MKMFRNMKIWLRFVLSFSLILSFTIVIIMVSISKLNDINDKVTRIMVVYNVRINLSNNMIDRARETAIDVRNILLAKYEKQSAENIHKMIADLSEHRKSYQESATNLKALITQEDPKGFDILGEAIAYADSVHQYQDKVIGLVLTDKVDEGTRLMFGQAYPRVKRWIKKTDDLVHYNEECNALRFTEAKEAQATALKTMLMLGFMAILLSVAIAYFLTMSITNPLKVATNLVLTRDLSLDISAYQTGGGELGVMIQSFSKNISERVKLEEEMSAKALYARNLIEASLDPLVTIDAEGKIMDVNQTTVKATGVSKVQLIGSDFADYFTEPDKARIGYQQVFSQGIVRDYPLTLRHSNGSTMDVLYNASVYKNEAGEVQGVFAAARDITDRKKLQEEMRASSIYARNLIEASLDPLVTINADGKIMDVNKTTIKATGVSKEQLIGSDFADYFTEPDKARIGYKLVFSQGIVKDYPLTLRHSDGSTIDVLYNASVYKNEAGDVQGVFAAARDITESKRQEKELITYRDQLEEMVKQRTAELSKVLEEVKETINILVSSSSEILAATTQVATGTAETATAISETSSTVEEVQQSSKQSSQKAKNVADSAQRVVQVFQNGQKAVEETINGMNKIREQMDSIAQTVVRLSEQSQSIGGIIASVTDIADQSNLLAVNAAIEAAKAGEQGKGFAVVAQEIKNLAGQSKQATLQVRNILNDIQKVTGAAVMATEQGSKAVESGLKQSVQAGEAIRILAESSNEAVQAATQIVASSQQQVVGMDQIGVAMQNINQAGTETAVSMVQAEKSAKSLYELGQKLKTMIEKFQG